MTGEGRFSTWGRLGGLVIAVAMLFVLAGAGGAAGEKPGDPPGKPSQVSVVTLTSDPVTITTPAEVYDLTFGPESAVSFTQQPGQVVTVTMAASLDAPDWGTLFCDVHAAVDLTNGPGESVYSAMVQTQITQRGDDWWQMAHMGRDLTRSIPAPASATDHTVIGVAWMDGPGDDVEGQTCYGTEYGFPYQEVTATVRVSVVTTQN